MHLLSFDSAGTLRLSEFYDAQIPPYAILSHTWGADSDEVTFKDIKKRRGADKEGYKKIEFCMRRAALDDLEYAWIDTCCIDKSNNTELSEAINSMFRWYRNAAACYVYLADVPSTAFSASRWFTRGWTLQELIAPARLQFYSSTGICLGSRDVLLQYVHDITAIPLVALKGEKPLDQFTVEDRMSWIEGRQTKREEDLAYSLLGILGVSMPLIYGEGRENAVSRLHTAIRDLRDSKRSQSTPPQPTDRKRFSLPLSIPDVTRPLAFIGRQTELNKLHGAVKSSTSDDPVVLHGLSGIGKTMLAYECATIHQSEFSAIFWVDGKTEASLEHGLLATARRIPHLKSVFSKNDTVDNARDALSAMKKWLGLLENNCWLIIVDNVPEAATYDLSSYLPTGTSQGHVVLISQSALPLSGHRISLDCMEDKKDCLDILVRYSGRPAIAQEPRIDDLIEHLGGLPLALTLTGTFLGHVAASPAEYLEQYQDSWLRLQEMSPTLPEHKGRKLHTIWEESYSRAQQRDYDAPNVLQLLASFGDHEISFDVLSAGAKGADPSTPEWYRHLMQNKFTLGHCIGVLRDQHLIQGSSVSRGYRMHPCVRAWIRAVYIKDPQHPLLALRSIADSLPVSFPDGPRTWKNVQKSLEHALHWVTWLNQKEWLRNAVEDLKKLGMLFLECYHYGPAALLYDKVIQIREDDPGIQRLDVVEEIACLGDAHLGLSRLEEAQRTLYEASKIQEAHPEIDLSVRLRTRLTCIRLLHRKDRLGYAGEGCVQLLQESKELLGPEHMLTLRIARALGVIYDAQEEYKQAMAMLERAMKGMERILSADDPQVLEVVCHVGIVHCSQDETTEGERLIQRAVHGYSEALGPTQVMTLDSQYHLAGVFSRTGRLNEAQELLEYVITKFGEVLGPTSFEGLSAEIRLGRVLQDNGQMRRAVRVWGQCITRSTEMLGADHIYTVGLGYNIASILLVMNKHMEEAEKMLRRAVDVYASREQVDRIWWLMSASSLAMVLERQGRHEEAGKLYWTCEEAIKSWPSPAPERELTGIAWTCTRVGLFFNRIQQWAEAAAMFERAYLYSKRISSDESEETLYALHELADVRRDEETYERAIAAHQQFIAHQRPHFPAPVTKAHLPLLRALYQLGCLLNRQNRGEEAEAHLLEALEGFTTVSGTGHQETLNTLTQLISTYMEMGYDEKATDCLLRYNRAQME